MGFLHLFIVNKSGGLILHRPLSPKAPQLGTNEWLRIGSTFHSLHAIAAEASPVRLPHGKNAGTFELLWCIIVAAEMPSDACQTAPDTGCWICCFVLTLCLSLYLILLANTTDGADDGIEQIVAGGMELRCFQTRTGLKFVVTAEPGTPDMNVVLRETYVLYAECVCKDPFYELEMPIRSDLFAQAVDALVERVEKNPGTSSRR
jgi:hypothetical protein